MRSFLPKALFFYSAIASFFVSISLVAASESLSPVVFAIFFLPVTAYFVLEFSRYIRGKSDIPGVIKSGEIIVLIILFLILTVFAVKNIYLDRKPYVLEPETLKPSSSPLIFKRPAETPIPSEK